MIGIDASEVSCGNEPGVSCGEEAREMTEALTAELLKAGPAEVDHSAPDIILLVSMSMSGLVPGLHNLGAPGRVK